MQKKFKFLLVVLLVVNFVNISFAENTFFEEGKEKYNKKEYDESKFLFQRSIVFDPKDINSYLYLAKIYNIEKNKSEEEKNINTVLLLNPKNEDAIYMLIKIKLKNSNYTEVKDLTDNFLEVCSELCDKKKSILESLKNIEPKNES